MRARLFEKLGLPLDLSDQDFRRLLQRPPPRAAGWPLQSPARFVESCIHLCESREAVSYIICMAMGILPASILLWHAIRWRAVEQVKVLGYASVHWQPNMIALSSIEIAWERTGRDPSYWPDQCRDADEILRYLLVERNAPILDRYISASTQGLVRDLRLRMQRCRTLCATLLARRWLGQRDVERLVVHLIWQTRRSSVWQ
jgi:hypothetical protein